jgi:hypothetical protein
MLFDLQQNVSFLMGYPAPVLPVVALIWTSVFNNPFAASGSKTNCIAVAKQPGFAYIGIFIWLYSVQVNRKQKICLQILVFVNLKSFPKSMILV